MFDIPFSNLSFLGMYVIAEWYFHGTSSNHTDKVVKWKLFQIDMENSILYIQNFQKYL